MLTSFSDNARIVAALDAGAVGYLLKDAEPEELIDGVRAVARGESPLDPRAARQLLRSRAPGAGQVELDAARDRGPRARRGKGSPTSRSPDGSASASGR